MVLFSHTLNIFRGAPWKGRLLHTSSILTPSTWRLISPHWGCAWFVRGNVLGDSLTAEPIEQYPGEHLEVDHSSTINSLDRYQSIPELSYKATQSIFHQNISVLNVSFL